MPLLEEFEKQCGELEDKLNNLRDSYWEFDIEVEIEDETIVITVSYENVSEMSPLDNIKY